MVSRYFQERFDCPYHYHPEAEITLILAGNGMRLIGDHLGRFGPGDLVILGPGLPHTYFHGPDFVPGPRKAGALVVQFLPGFLGGALASAPEARRARGLMARAGRGLRVPPCVAAQIAPVLEGIAAASGLARVGLLLQSLEMLAGAHGLEPLAGGGFRAEWNATQAGRLERVTEWITQRFRTPLRLEDAARVAHMTPPAFSRFFKRATHRTFVEFVHELRVAHACVRLLETGDTVLSVAQEAGYENLSNFNRCFRKVKGMTPTEFRKKAAGSF